jgi:ketosteroid isomerase-like protein
MSDSKLQLLSDRAEISEVVARFATALDYKDWPLFRSCFTDEIEADYSDLRGEPLAVVNADMFVNQRREALEGLTTQHLSTNHIITVEGDSATCTSCAVIHRLRPRNDGHDAFDTHGYYTHALTRTAEGWKIYKVRQKVLWSLGDPQVHGFHRTKGSDITEG